MQKIISFDSQILNSIQACPQKTFYNFVRGLQPMHKAAPLERGSLIHDMLEVYYSLIGQCINQKNPIWAEMGAVGFTERPTTRAEAAQFAIEVGRWRLSLIELPISDGTEMLRHFKEYQEKYFNENWRPLAVERVGSIVLYEDENYKFIYNFKIDLIINDGSNILWVDHKTASRHSEPSSMSNQFIGYAYGLSIPYGIINRIGLQKTIGKERFQRIYMNYAKDRIDEWKQNTIESAFFLAQCMEHQHWPMNLTSCDKYSGCIYEAVCSQPKIIRPLTIEKHYHEGITWDVANILKKEEV